MNVIFKLALYLEKPRKELQAHYYRYRHWLHLPCADIEQNPWMKDPGAQELLKLLSKYGPLKPSDLDSLNLQNLLKKWNKSMPLDRHFYQMMQQQLDLWSSYANLSLQYFLNSKEGKNWLKKRKRLKRKPVFELDQTYKQTKETAWHREGRIRELLRNYPLMRWQDLRDLGVRNAQSLYENFPFRENYRKRFLRTIPIQTGYLQKEDLVESHKNPMR